MVVAKEPHHLPRRKITYRRTNDNDQRVSDSVVAGSQFELAPTTQRPNLSLS
jgi:hypothetical protein